MLMLPDGARLLHVGMQNGGVVLWALVDTRNPVTTRRIIFRGTGHPINDASNLIHIGTTIDEERGLVWHIFERV